MSESTWRTLTEYEVGILTGRPAAEASIALDRAGVTVPPERRITMEDIDAGKPDPSGLLTLVERCDAHATCFVGDTVDDVRTTLRAAESDPGRRYFAVGVLTGGLRGDRGRRVFAEEGADRVVETVNEVPSSITHLPSS